MSKLDDLHKLIKLLQEFELPVSPILEYAINEKIEEYSSLPDETTETAEQFEESPIPDNDKDQPDEIILTRQMIKDAEAPNGGYTRSQLEAIGVEWPPAKGWIEWAIGKTVTKKQFEDFNRIVYRDSSPLPPKKEEPLKQTNKTHSVKPSKEEGPIIKKYEKRKKIIVQTIMRLSRPATLREVTRRINRTAWGQGPIREEDVLSLLLEIPEISSSDGKYYLK